ncbi:hypothetical protein, partial [Klebsiella pneumoniae]|uniref:hypothetical protein n=1 Tax=Klebsiella pneumoniae TaxID=573 RepID=UPI001B8AF7AC
EWVHVQLHQQKGMISLSPPTICNSALSTSDGNHPLDAYPAAKVKSSVALPYGTDLSTHLACPGEQLSCMSHYRGLVWISKIIVRQGQ